MAQGPSRDRPHRLVILSPAAEEDRFKVHLDTDRRWGSEQAENYDNLLAEAMEQLADQPAIVPLIENLSGVRKYLVRWKNARDGHYIFFQEIDSGIYVLRILHSAMNWPDYLG